MAVGLSADGDYITRGSIPSGGAGTLSDGAFTNYFLGGWAYHPTSGNSNAATSEGAVFNTVAGARQQQFGKDNTFGAGDHTGPQLRFIGNSDGSAQVVFGGGDQPPFDTWIYYALLDNSTDGMVAAWRTLADGTWHSEVLTNNNAGSQYINSFYVGSSGTTQVLFGHYAYIRARYGTGITLTDATTYAESDATIAGDWGFWPLADNSDTADTSGNSRTLTFGGTLTSETSPTFTVPSVPKRLMLMGIG